MNRLNISKINCLGQDQENSLQGQEVLILEPPYVRWETLSWIPIAACSPTHLQGLVLVDTECHHVAQVSPKMIPKN